MSQHRLSLSLPVNEENEMDEYSRPASDPGGIYSNRPMPPQFNRQFQQQQPLLIQAPPVPEPKVPNEHDITANRVEIVASVIVPLLFLGFNLLYWPWLIASSDYFSQEMSTVFAS